MSSLDGARQIETLLAPMRSRRAAYLCATVAIALLPLVFTDSYWRTNLIICALNVMLAIGLDFVLGYAGQLNLGQSAFFGLGAYVSTLLIMRLGVPFWLPLSGRGRVLRPRRHHPVAVRHAAARPLPCDRLARFRGHHLSDPAQLDQPHAGAARHLRNSAAAAARVAEAAARRPPRPAQPVLPGGRICAAELSAARPAHPLAGRRGADRDPRGRGLGRLAGNQRRGLEGVRIRD